MPMKPSTLRIGRRYRANRLADSYDALVIGSGMGGLTTAALLSELGWRVCVLEQHYTAGGYTHSYERNGYEWDVGVHYIGDVGTRTRTRLMFDFQFATPVALLLDLQKTDHCSLADASFGTLLERIGLPH